MSASIEPEKDEVTLVAHASAYGGVATHLNQFASVLKGMTTIRNVFLFTNSDIAVSRDGGFPAPTVIPTLNSLWATSQLLLQLVVPLNFIREIWLSARYFNAICGKHVVITSHDPHAFWGLALFAGRLEYFLFVLPDKREEAAAGKLVKFKDVIFRGWQKCMHRIVNWHLRQRSIRLVAPTPYAAEVWASLLDIDTSEVLVIPNPPFLGRPCDGMLEDMQEDTVVVDKIVRLVTTGLKLVLSVGHIVDYKNPLQWLELVKIAHDRDDALLFVWVGDGEMFDEVLTSAAGYDRIILAGRLNQADLRKLYDVCWAFFHPAIKESQGIVVIDALTLGIPVILNESEALPGLMGDFAAGFILDCSRGDASDGFNRILKMLDVPDVYRQASLHAVQLSQQLYSCEKWLHELRKLFSKSKKLSNDENRDK